MIIRLVLGFFVTLMIISSCCFSWVVVLGWVMYGEKVRDVFICYLEKDLGLVVLPRILLLFVLFMIIEYFFEFEISGFFDFCYYVISLVFVVLVDGDCVLL